MGIIRHAVRKKKRKNKILDQL